MNPDTEYDENTDENEQQPDIRSLRARAAQAKEYEQQNAQLRREIMFAKAGIDTDSKVGKMLFRTWEGESLDDLRAEAEELGLVNRSGNSIPADEQSQADFRRGLAGGQTITPPDEQAVDPYDDVYSNFYEERKRGVPLQEAQLAAIDRILVAASNGDKRVLFDQNEWDRQAQRGY